MSPLIPDSPIYIFCYCVINRGLPYCLSNVSNCHFLSVLIWRRPKSCKCGDLRGQLATTVCKEKNVYSPSVGEGMDEFGRTEVYSAVPKTSLQLLWSLAAVIHILHVKYELLQTLALYFLSKKCKKSKPETENFCLRSENDTVCLHEWGTAFNSKVNALHFRLVSVYFCFVSSWQVFADKLESSM